MSASAILEGILTLAAADTGTGGLAHATTPLVPTRSGVFGWFSLEADQDFELPYVVASVTASESYNCFAATAEAEMYDVQVGAYSLRRVNDALGTHDALVQRIKGVLHRVSPASGYSQLIPTAQSVVAQIQGDAIVTILEMDCFKGNADVSV